MGLLSAEEFEQVWEEQGLKHRIARFHQFLLERGLQPMSVPDYLFIEHVKDDILTAFLVKGVKEHADGRQEYADAGSEDEGSEIGSFPGQPRATSDDAGDDAAGDGP